MTIPEPPEPQLPDDPDLPEKKLPVVEDEPKSRVFTLLLGPPSALRYSGSFRQA
jgi:hypothetical protein